MTNFPTFSGQVTLRQRDQLPDSPGIYFVFDLNNNLLYVGKAKNLRSRWGGSTHHRYKQFSKKGLDKIILKYLVIHSISEIDKLELEYIEQFKPSLNDSKVKKYLPKTSPRFSELQRLLKLINTPLFPSAKSWEKDGKIITREDHDLFRGFIAGVFPDKIPMIIVVCRQNMGTILMNRIFHRTKKRFFIDKRENFIYSRYLFDAREKIFVFVELFDSDLSDVVFEKVYPYLVDREVVGVTVKTLINQSFLMSALEKFPITRPHAIIDYLLNICPNLEPVFGLNLNKELIW